MSAYNDEKADMNRGDNNIHMVVVTNSEQMMHALAIRSICIFEETGLAIDQAFDGNDFQSTHILAYCDDQPIGATRVRWFRDFAKIERTAFRKSYRSARILKQCSYFIFDHVARKGYTKLVTHAEPKYALVWKRVLGFRETLGRPAVMAGSHGPYIELVKELFPTENVITIDSEPNILFRIEGHWDRPSNFESDVRS